MTKSTKTSSKILKGSALVVVLLLLASSAWFVLRHSSNSSSKRPSENSSGYINMNSATKGDQSYSDSKKTNSADSNTPAPTTPDRQSVTPVISTWGQDSENLMVNGFVQNIVEDGGTCTLTLKKAANVVIQSRQAVANATNTSCGQTDVALSRLSPGVWNATLSYNSTTAAGTSASVDITVK